MAIKLKDGYACSICGKIYTDPTAANACRDGHNYIYVPILETDIDKLIQFIFTKDEKLITKTLMDSLYKFKRHIT